MFGDPGEHTGTDFFAIVEGPNETAPLRVEQDAVRAS
jgi:hypothetical protein